MSRLPAMIEGTPLAELNARELAAASLIANGAPYSARTFIAAGFPSRSAAVRASERKNAVAFRYFREGVRYMIDCRFQSLAGKAISTLEAALDNPKGDTAVRAALALLDRAGFARPQEISVTHHDHRTEAELIASIRSRLAGLSENDRSRILAPLPAETREAIDVEFE